MTVSNADSSCNRYRPVIEDFRTFLEACNTPLPHTIWRNPSRLSASDFIEWLGIDRVLGTPSRILPDVWRTTSTDCFAYWSAYLGGLLHVQEEIAALPVHLLAPEPGERILDMCAAPGNKTAQISLLMDRTGTVIANDISAKRLGVVRTTMDRLSLSNVALSSVDGREFPLSTGLFDGVLVDSPCSCEGTCRKSGNSLIQTDSAARNQLAAVQRSLLHRALRLCRPGGRVVYSTCTFAPEENECVIDDVLFETDWQQEFRIEAQQREGLVFSGGLTRWNGRNFNSEVEKTMRIWPHQNDTGGFFVAVLRRNHDISNDDRDVLRCDHAASHGDPGAPAIRNPVRMRYTEKLSDHAPWLERFGIREEIADSFVVIGRSGKYASVVDRSLEIPLDLPITAAGVRAINLKSGESRLSTAGAFLFGSSAGEEVVELSEDQLRAYLAGKKQRYPHSARLRSGTTRVFSRNQPFGIALLDGIDLESRFPKVWAGVDVRSRIASLPV